MGRHTQFLHNNNNNEEAADHATGRRSMPPCSPVVANDPACRTPPFIESVAPQRETRGACVSIGNSTRSEMMIVIIEALVDRLPHTFAGSDVSRIRLGFSLLTDKQNKKNQRETKETKSSGHGNAA